MSTDGSHPDLSPPCRGVCERPDVAVVSGSYGAGHDAAAKALAAQLGAAGCRVRHLDVAEELPWGSGRLLRRLYLAQLRLLPTSWGSTLRLLQHDGFLARSVRRALGLLGHRLVREVATADLVISTHPFASQALGQARGRGAVSAPVITYMTDASVHRLWVHPFVDLHLAIHEISAGQARQLGGSACVVAPAVLDRPVTAPGWRPPWPTSMPAALIVGGASGVGDLAATARDVQATGVMTPVVACGSNERLRHELAARPGVVALGWRDDLGSLVAHADCVVQNAGGMTSLEAIAAGTPTFTYRPIPGHGVTNAEALDAAGLVPLVRDRAALASHLVEVVAGEAASPLLGAAPGVVETLLATGLLAGLVAIPVHDLGLVA